MVEADEPDQFDITKLTPLLTGDMVGGEGIKDPNVFLIGNMVYMLASYATTESHLTLDERTVGHAGGDIYSTGLTRSRTGAAISGDGKRFQWIGDVSPRSHYPILPSSPTPSWDNYCQRIGALLPLETGGYLAFYDGGASVEDNYEEKTGLATTFDLRTYYSLSPDAPALRSPHSSGSLRYVDVLPVGYELFYYYEIANPSGAHELRVSVMERS